MIAYRANDTKSFEIARKYKKKVLRKGGVYKGGLELENQEYEVVESEDCIESRHKFAGTMIKVVQRIGESPKITCEPYNKNKESLLTQEFPRLFLLRVMFPPIINLVCKLLHILDCMINHLQKVHFLTR